jgi:hypothetical protein
MGSDYMRDIIEYDDGWYITDHGLFPRDHAHYFIRTNRYDELDWESHISDKGWKGFSSALRVARALASRQKSSVA